MDTKAIEAIIKKLCAGKFPLEFYITHEGKLLSYKSIFLSIDSNSFAIDFLQPIVGNNYVFPQRDVQIGFGEVGGHYKFNTKIIEKITKQKIILLTIPTNIEKFERRKYPRIFFNEQNPAKVWFNFPQGHPRWRKKRWEGRLLNISQGGIAFTSDFVKFNNLVEPDDKLEILIKGSEKTIRHVKIVHVQPHHNICGCKFFNANIESKRPDLFKEKNNLTTERRTTYRFKIPPTEKVKFELITSDNLVAHGHILNIGLGGVEINLPDDYLASNLSPNENLTLKIDLPPFKEIVTLSQIKHVKGNNIGLEFNKLPQIEQDKIIDFIRGKWKEEDTTSEEK